MEMKLKLDRPIITYDLETTGVEVASDRIVQIAIKKRFPNGEYQMKTKLINPTIPIPKEASDIHGITDDIVKNSLPFKEIAQPLFEVMSGCDLLGYNILRFDLPLLVEEFLRCGINFPENDVKIIDSQTIFYKKEPRTLSAALMFYNNEELVDAHDAANDVNATEKVFFAQIERYSDMGDTVEELSSFCSDGKKIIDYAGKLSYNDNNEIIFTFGKNKGKKVTDDVNYVNWMLRSDFPLHTKMMLKKIINFTL